MSESSETASQSVRISDIRDETRAWPRFALDDARVGEFATIYDAEGSSALPPIEVVPDGQGGYLPAEGRHRIAAARLLVWSELPAIVLTVPPGSTPIAVAYVRGLETAATAAKPLSLAERRAAIQRLVVDLPQLSDREVGRLVGVAHTTVSRQRAGLRHPPSPDEEAEIGDEYIAQRTAADVAQRLLKALERIRQMRGLGVHDALFGDRMGTRMAEVLESAYGDDAIEKAETFADWIKRAIAELRGAR